MKLDNSSFLLNGEIELNEEAINKMRLPNFTLAPRGFHVESCMLPARFNDTLKFFFPDSVHFGEVESFSLNYFGADIQNTIRGLFVESRNGLTYKV